MQMATHSATPGSLGGTGAALDASGNAGGAEVVLGDSVAAGGFSSFAGEAAAGELVFADEVGIGVFTTGFVFAFVIAKTKRSA